ncbi:MAG: TonB-dependent receptor [Caulobacteraceae bacterium]|nr:TonB-dependent receptor [Caulobacteraceae bacterium]
MKSVYLAAVLGGVSLFALLAGAAQAAEVRGVVVDVTSKAPLPGAQVTSGEQSAIADESGHFILDGLETGQQTLTASYVGYEDRVQEVTVAPQPIDTVLSLVVSDRVSTLVITGGSQRRALQTKKVADQIEDVLSANDVGKLPDQNVAEAVRRLPGVSVANDQGEGRYVIIRGVNPNLANVTINNLTAPAPEPEGRQVKLDDIPSSLISRVKVIKSLTPDLDANAIAGQVDIDTVSAFDRNRTFANTRFAEGRYDLNGENPYEVDATVGGVFGPGSQFGAVLSANLSNRPIESENFGSSGPSYSSVAKGGFITLLPNLIEYRDYNLVRKRNGLVGNFDWRPTDDIRFYLRSNYSKFSDDETRDRYRIDGASTASIVPTSNTAGAFNGRGIAHVRRRQEVDTTKGLSIGGDFTLPVGTLTVTGAVSKADKVDPLRSEWQFRTASGVVPVAYDLTGLFYTFTPTTPASNPYFDPTKYSFNSFNLDHRKATEKLQQLAADYKAPIGWGDDSTIKIGFKYADTHKTNDRAFESYTAKAPAFTLADTGPLTDPVTVYDGRYTLGPRVNYVSAYAYFKANPAKFTYDPTSVTNALVNDYDLTEKLTAGYAMADLKFGGWTIVPGVRMEKVEGEYKAKTAKLGVSTINDPFNQFGKFGDTDFFPSLNLRYDMSDNVVLRAAATTSIGRPNYADLAPYVSIDTSGSGTVGLGNPGLTAAKAKNFDVDAEYYLPGQGILSGGVFYKSIDDPIFSGTRLPTAAEQTAYGVSAGAAVTQPFNARQGNLWGVELNLETHFASLPSPLDGLGFSGNITFVNSSARGVPGRIDEMPLALQSDQVSTAQLLYEKYGFTARVAYSRRSQYLLAAGAGPTTDQYVDDYASIDARVAYSFDNSLATVFLEGTNLKDTPYRIFVGNPSQMIENERYGASYRAGLQLSF